MRIQHTRYKGDFKRKLFEKFSRAKEIKKITATVTSNRKIYLLFKSTLKWMRATRFILIRKYINFPWKWKKKLFLKSNFPINESFNKIKSVNFEK